MEKYNCFVKKFRLNPFFKYNKGIKRINDLLIETRFKGVSIIECKLLISNIDKIIKLTPKWELIFDNIVINNKERDITDSELLVMIYSSYIKYYEHKEKSKIYYCLNKIGNRLRQNFKLDKDNIFLDSFSKNYFSKSDNVFIDFLVNEFLKSSTTLKETNFFDLFYISEDSKLYLDILNISKKRGKINEIFSDNIKK